MEHKTKSMTTIINSDVAGGDAADRLSSLPEHLISDILSKLPIDSAVATSILSRHWRHQWTYITRLRVTSLNIPDCDELSDILTTVDIILRKLNLQTFYLEFNLQYLDTDELEEANAYELYREFLPHWFQRLCSFHTELFEVFERGNYLSIHIQNTAFVSTMSDFICSCSRIEQNTLSLPECIFQNKTLFQLMLRFHKFELKLPNYVHLPNLNTLSLHISESDLPLMRTIFKSLPLLENLDISAFLYGHDHFIDISAPSLKIFRIEFKGRDSQTTISIDAPKLKRIYISIWQCLVSFRFVKISTHLLTTTLWYPSFIGDEVAILKLVKAISCTRSLRLCCTILNVLNSYNVDELPTFHNLVNLSLTLSDVENMNLAIPVWILRKLKTIKVEGLVKDYDKEFSLLENILSKGNVLERLICLFMPIVREPKMDSLKKEKDFIKALFMLPRVSSSCEIVFHGISGCSSTDVVEDGSLT